MSSTRATIIGASQKSLSTDESKRNTSFSANGHADPIFPEKSLDPIFFINFGLYGDAIALRLATLICLVGIDENYF